MGPDKWYPFRRVVQLNGIHLERFDYFGAGISWCVNRHSMRYISPMSVVSQRKLVSGWWLQRQAPPCGLLVAREGLYFFYLYGLSECVSGSCGLQLPEEEDVLSTPPSSAKSDSDWTVLEHCLDWLDWLYHLDSMCFIVTVWSIGAT